MKAFEVIGFATPDGETICASCVAEDDRDTNDLTPIFAGDENAEEFDCAICGEALSEF